MISKLKLKNTHINRTIQQYKDKMIEYNGAVDKKQVKFAEQLTNLVYNNTNNKVDVIIARCGMGKSTIVNSIIDNLVHNIYIGTLLDDKSKYTGEGVIVITDSIERLDGIKDSLGECCYIMKYDDTAKESENRKTFDIQLKEQYKYPVLLMTTQKYFRLKEDERDFMYKWALGNRNIAFIDEKPILTKEDDISEIFLSNIRVALDECEESQDKQYLLDTFEKIYSDIDYIRKTYSQKYEVMWFKSSKKSLLISEDEDNKFFEILSKNVSTLIYNNVLTLKRVYTDGALYVNKKNKGQSNNRHFYVMNDNSDKFDTDKCKYFILDATAMFDIDYTINESIFNYIEVDDKKENSDINIHHITFNANQKVFLSEPKIIDLVCNWINENFGEDVFVTTYGKKKGIYNQFDRKLETKNVAYYGVIKGRNDWSNIKDMVHIGFNRQADTVYLLTYLYIDRKRNHGFNWNEADDIKIENKINTILSMEKGLFEDVLMKKIMRSKILVDTEQNIMRIKCRNFSNMDKCNVFIVASSIYSDYISRLCNKLNAGLLIDLPKEFEEYKVMSRKPDEGKQITSTQKLLKYLKSVEIGRVIKMKDIEFESGLTKPQIKNARKNETIIKWFEEHKGEKKGQYIA